MKIDANSKFIVTLTADDARTGWKKGKKLYPKGVYQQGNGKTLVGVGNIELNNSVRFSLPVNIVNVEIIDNKSCCKVKTNTPK